MWIRLSITILIALTLSNCTGTKPKVAQQKPLPESEMCKILKKSTYPQAQVQKIADHQYTLMQNHCKILKEQDQFPFTYVQASNKKEPCKLYVGYTKDNEFFKEDSWNVYWDGECKDGFATGLGREIEKSKDTYRWQIGVYHKGELKDYIVSRDLKERILKEGYISEKEDYYVSTNIRLYRHNLRVVQAVRETNKIDGTDYLYLTSPLWGEKYQWYKAYNNFKYEFIHPSNDPSQPEYDYTFSMTDKNTTGWGIYKPRGSEPISGRYEKRIFTEQDLPKPFKDEANTVLMEVYSAVTKAYKAQEIAQEMQTKYKNKICKKSVKVDYMDNDEYKEICTQAKDKALIKDISEEAEHVHKSNIFHLQYRRELSKKDRQELIALEKEKISDIHKYKDNDWRSLSDFIGMLSPDSSWDKVFFE